MQTISLDPKIIKENVKCVIDTTLMIIDVIFGTDDDKDSKESDKSWIADVIDVIDAIVFINSIALIPSKKSYFSLADKFLTVIL